MASSLPGRVAATLVHRLRLGRISHSGCKAPPERRTTQSPGRSSWMRRMTARVVACGPSSSRMDMPQRSFLRLLGPLPQPFWPGLEADDDARHNMALVPVMPLTLSTRLNAKTTPCPGKTSAEHDERNGPESTAPTTRSCACLPKRSAADELVLVAQGFTIFEPV